MSVAHEHFASNLLRGRLLGLAQGWGQGRGPGAILACVPGERHELGLLAFGVALHRRGWRITYLGTDSPIGPVADISRSVVPSVVVLLGMTEEGLDVRAPGLDPHDVDVAYIAPKIRAGLVDEMSFMFRIDAGQWSPDYMEFRIERVDLHRGDVAIVGYGANPYTSSALRDPAAAVQARELARLQLATA